MTEQQRAETVQTSIDILEREREQLLGRAQGLGPAIDVLRLSIGEQPRYDAAHMLPGPASPPDPDPPADEEEPGPDPEPPARKKAPNRAGKRGGEKWKTPGSGRGQNQCRKCSAIVYVGYKTKVCPACGQGKLRKVPK
jgi:hypothetical protein